MKAFGVICIIIVIAVSSCVLANQNDSRCGDNLTWKISANGDLEVTGEGEMWSFSWGSAPWFSERNGIKNVSIQSGVKSVGDYAFTDCSALESVYFSDSVTKIGRYAFRACKSLMSIITNEVEIIENAAFYQCEKLMNVTLSTSLKRIGTLAFSLCHTLKNVEIPSDVKEIGSGAFCGCTDLESINVQRYNEDYTSNDGVLFNSDSTTLVQYPAGKKEKAYSIPESVRSIQEYAFDNCKHITNVTIPRNVASIGKNAFTYCNSLISFVVNDYNLYFNSIDGVLFTRDCKELISYPTGKKNTSYVIPDNVVTIREYAFTSNTHIENITISGSVRKIGGSCFSGCSKLNMVSISKNVSSIGSNAFGNCEALSFITVEEGNNVFYSDDGVLFKTEGKGLVQYPSGKNDSVYYIPEGVEYIGTLSFYSCWRLNEVVIPYGVKSIANRAFEECTAMVNVTILSTVVSIEKEAFRDCGLVNLFFAGSDPVSTNCLASCDNLENICVSRDYSSSDFCGHTTSKSDVCLSFRNMSNSCFEPIRVNGSFVSQKKKKAYEWEEQSEPCFKHQCHNDSGLIAWSLCNKTSDVTAICVNNECKPTVNDRMISVKLEFDEDIDPAIINITQIIETITERNDSLSSDNLEIGYEINEKGNVVSIIVYIQNVDTANAVVEAIKSLNQECHFLE